MRRPNPPTGRSERGTCRNRDRVRDALGSLDAIVDDFEDLFQRVQDAILPIPGIGDLAVYDAATRIGASLGG